MNNRVLGTLALLGAPFLSRKLSKDPIWQDFAGHDTVIVLSQSTFFN